MSQQSEVSALPPALRGTDPGSFTHHTIANRWPGIAGRVIEENDFPAQVNDRIRALRDDLPDGTIRPIDDPEAPDEALWTEWAAPHLGKSWLEAPWFFGENYFYRRILEATGYFRRSTPGGRRDPFADQKEQGLTQATDGIRALAAGRARALDDGDAWRTELDRLVRTALWGNQADLSMWAADEEAPDHLGTGREEAHLLADDTSSALDRLDALDPPVRVDVWADNAGFELISDLALIDGLLAVESIEPVVVHLKVHPTFVSDATVDDVHETLTVLADAEDTAVRNWAGRLQRAIATGRLRLRDAWVWTSPLRAREFPSAVRADLARSDLVVSKGDANYRRLLGDRHWPFTTPFEEAAAPLPTPVLALRTLKSEVAAGLTAGQVDRLDDEDPEWLVDGEWGVIQFAPATAGAGNPDIEN